MTYGSQTIRIIAVVLSYIGMLGGEVNAALMIENFSLTSDSVRFDIHGTFPSTPPARLASGFSFTNPEVNENPGFALGSFRFAATASFTGTQVLRDDPGPIATGGSQFGDYFFVSFESEFSPNQRIDGTVTAAWSNPAFDINAVDSLNVFWGVGAPSGALEDGVFIGAVPVPEPASVLLLSFAIASLPCRRNRI